MLALQLDPNKEGKLSNNKLKKCILVFWGILFLGSCVKQDTSEELYQIFSDARQYQLDTNPISATYAGIHTLNDRMPSVSREQIEKNLKFWKSIYNRLEKIQLNALSKKDKVNHKIFRRIINSRIKGIEYKDHYMPFNAASGFHTGLARLYKATPFKTVEDYQDYISRLLDFPRYFDEQIANMRIGIKTGISGPKVVFIPYDDPPVAMSPIRPKYPEIAQEAGIEGVVVVQAFIDKKGRVKETIILKGIPNTGLDEAAMEAIRKTRFRPAKQRERAVGVWISIPVNFKLK